MTISELSSLLSHATGGHEEKAARLAEKYSSIIAIAEAPIGEIAETLDGDMKTSVYIKVAIALNSRRNYGKVRTVSVDDECAIEEYLTSLCINRSVETVFLLSFDKSGRLVAADKAGEGTVNASSVIPRRLIELAKLRRAHTVAVAHNHPSGEAVASAEDILALGTLRSLFIDADIGFSASYVVAGHRCVRVTEKA